MRNTSLNSTRSVRKLLGGWLVLLLAGAASAQPAWPLVQDQTSSPPGASVTFNAAASGAGNLTYQWQKNGVVLPGATNASLTVADVQPHSAGIYTVIVADGSKSTNASSLLGIYTIHKLVGAGTELQKDIRHPLGGIYDQVLLHGAAVTVTADPGQVTRTSYVDVDDDIVQVEFAGAGTLSLLLDNASGPAAPVNYNQPGVSYMKGRAGIVITGADETTNVSVFSVGRANAVNQAIFRPGTTYNGAADIAFVAIHGGNGKFGGIRTANARYSAIKGLTGIYAPEVQFTGPVLVGNINAVDAATPVLLLGSASDTQVTGGDLKQSNFQPVRVSGMTQLRFSNGSTSHGTLLPAQSNQARLEQAGMDVSTRIAANPLHPGATL